MLVEIIAHRVKHLGALDENILYAVVDNEVDITTAVTEFGIFKAVVGHTVLDLHNRERTQRLTEHSQFAGMDGNLTGLSAEHIALDTYEVADVEQLFEHDIIKVFILART